MSNARPAGRPWRFAALLLPLVSCLAPGPASGAEGSWKQWGGPSRDFQVELDLAKDWPADGPQRIWKRELGEGYSSIVVDRDLLFTLVRFTEAKEREGNEAIVALSTETGETAWQHVYPAPIPEKIGDAFGLGPRSTPLVVGDRLITVGLLGLVHCLDRASGKVLWTRDLPSQAGGRLPVWGYAPSPLAHGENVIVQPGGEGSSIASLRISDGKIVWRSLDYYPSYASPTLIEVDGQEQLVCFVGTHVVGIDPGTGAELWSHPHENRWKDNINTPIWGPSDQILYLSSYGDVGSRALHLNRDAETGATRVEERWVQRRVKHGHASVVRIGSTVYGTSGNYEAPFFFVAVDVASGAMHYRKRGFNRSHCLRVGSELLLLDDDGVLTLVTPDREKVTVHARAKILETTPAWTGPALSGNTLFVRDRKEIAAYRLPLAD